VEDVPVMGRLVVLQRHNRIASSYDCQVCACPLNFTGSVTVVRSPSFGVLPPTLLDATNHNSKSQRQGSVTTRMQ
jgi:hypothetical protein